MNPHDILSNYYQLLKQGNTETLLEAFHPSGWLDEPLYGKVNGLDGIRDSLERQTEFIRKFAVSCFSTTTTEQRIAAEWTLEFQKEGDLPVALIADYEENRITSLRIYHTTWCLNGKHKIRPKVLPQATHLEEPKVIRDYMEDIAKPDKDLVLSLYTPNGYFREPSGSAFKHQGENGIAEFYTVALSGGGIPLKHCTATFDDTIFVVEYTLSEWGGVQIPEQAGIAVYELNNTQDKIRAVRIYDDITPPFE